MFTKINQKLCNNLIQKYPFLDSVHLPIHNKNKKEVYIEPTITFATTPEPEKFLELKYEIYSLVHEQTNKKPILRAGWNLKSNKE